jgi:hypothetical protein
MAAGVTFAKAVKAAVTMTGVGVNDDTVQIGGIVYKFEATPAAAYDVDIKTDATTQAAALVAAINADGTAGAYYETGTVAHPHVTATNADGVITLTANVGGDWAQAIALVDNMTNGTVAGASFDDITTGTDGSGSLATFVAALLSNNQLNSDTIHDLKGLD